MTTPTTATAAPVAMTKPATPVAPSPHVETDDDPGAAPLSRGTALFVIVVAFLGAVLALIDVFVNGWLAALAHLGWTVGVFLVISLFLGSFLLVILGGRQAPSSEVPAASP